MALLLGWLPADGLRDADGDVGSRVPARAGVSRVRHLASSQWTNGCPRSCPLGIRSATYWSTCSRARHYDRAIQRAPQRHTASQHCQRLSQRPHSGKTTQTIVAREYEADVHQHINNCVYGDWLYEGFQFDTARGRPYRCRGAPSFSHPGVFTPAASRRPGADRDIDSSRWLATAMRRANSVRHSQRRSHPARSDPLSCSGA